MLKATGLPILHRRWDVIEIYMTLGDSGQKNLLDTSSYYIPITNKYLISRIKIETATVSLVCVSRIYHN
jgi:hypothetical protein